MTESTYCIYMHRNKINNKVYIGQTCQKPEHRWGKDGVKYKTCSVFWSAIQKYGWDNFEHIILEKGLTLEQANKLEQHYIKQYHSLSTENGYNCQSGGSNYKMSEEHKQKLSKANIGKHPHQGELNPMYGKHMSDDTKQKIRLSQMNTISVECIETGQVFDSCHLAAAWAGLKRDGHIPEVCKGKRKTAGGYHWKYAKKEV